MIVAGTSRARLGPAAALIDTSRQTVAACEENRLTRAVDTGTAGPRGSRLRSCCATSGAITGEISRSIAVDEDIDARRAHAEMRFARQDSIQRSCSSVMQSAARLGRMGVSDRNR